MLTKQFRTIVRTNQEPTDHEVLWFYKKQLWYYNDVTAKWEPIMMSYIDSNWIKGGIKVAQTEEELNTTPPNCLKINSLGYVHDTKKLYIYDNNIWTQLPFGIDAGSVVTRLEIEEVLKDLTIKKEGDKITLSYLNQVLGEVIDEVGNTQAGLSSADVETLIKKLKLEKTDSGAVYLRYNNNTVLGSFFDESGSGGLGQEEVEALIKNLKISKNAAGNVLLSYGNFPISMYTDSVTPIDLKNILNYFENKNLTVKTVDYKEFINGNVEDGIYLLEGDISSLGSTTFAVGFANTLNSTARIRCLTTAGGINITKEGEVSLSSKFNIFYRNYSAMGAYDTKWTNYLIVSNEIYLQLEVAVIFPLDSSRVTASVTLEGDVVALWEESFKANNPVGIYLTNLKASVGDNTYQMNLLFRSFNWYPDVKNGDATILAHYETEQLKFRMPCFKNGVESTIAFELSAVLYPNTNKLDLTIYKADTLE